MNVTLLRLVFCLWVGLPTLAHADLWQENIKPTFEHGFDTTGLAILAAGGAGVALLVPNDNSLNPKDSKELGMSGRTLVIGDMFGTGFPGLLIAITQYHYDEIAGSRHFNALLYTFLTSRIIKYSTKRKRPHGGNSHSFPSSHASTAFASATSLYLSYGWKWGIPAFLIATFVGLERMAEKAHWASDVWAGAAIGIFWGRATHFDRTDNNNTTWSPFLLPGGGGLSLKHVF